MQRKVGEKGGRRRGGEEILAMLGEKEERPRPKRKKWIFLAGGALLAAAVALLLLLPREETSQSEALYREYRVERGDIIVGQNESSSISLSRETVTFSVSSTVEEVYVKAGASVKAGDPLLKLSAEEISAGLATYELELEQAALEVEKAKLDQQTGLLKAQQEYESSVQNGKLASSQETLTVNELQLAVTNAEKAYSDAQRAYEDYYQASASFVSRKARLENLEEAIEELKEEIEDEEQAASSSSLSSLKSELASYQEYYNEYKAEFTETYGSGVEDTDDVADQLATLSANVEKTQLALAKANLALNTGSTGADQSSALAKSEASTAETTLELKKMQLQQAVDAAQEKYARLAAEITELKESIALDGLVLSPCTGMVAGVNVEAGESFDVTYNEDLGMLLEQTLCTLTDISSVYVPITISEEDILDVSIGQEANVTMNAFEGRDFAAEVDAITVESSRSGAATVSYTVNVRLKGENTQLMYEGMSADVTLIQRAALDVLYVNAAAVANTNGVATVQKLVNGEQVAAEVKTGFSDGRYVEILEGLQEGDTVLAESAVGRE
ncbi:MAG TPA: efflux RND transporter periplasmic adaptor subunit [Feifaniaceae bacterium]|nr:efflux RND transporter periplasmic adaptor subunit [Feifaniaceae bacterium]